jgi:hypothetical protein
MPATKEKPAATRKPAARKPTASKPAVKKPAAQKPAAGGKTLTVNEVAEKLGITAKALRVRLRRENGGPVVGKGKRYALTNADVQRLAKSE